MQSESIEMHADAFVEQNLPEPLVAELKEFLRGQVFVRGDIE